MPAASGIPYGQHFFPGIALHRWMRGDAEGRSGRDAVLQRRLYFCPGWNGWNPDPWKREDAEGGMLMHRFMGNFMKGICVE